MPSANQTGDGIMSNSDYITTRVFACVMLLGLSLGCGTNELAPEKKRIPARPAIELTQRSRMSFHESRYQAFVSGAVIAQVNGAELTTQIPKTQIDSLLNKLQEIGFFALSETVIRARIDEISTRTGKNLAVADYGVDSLTVRYGDKENTVSWRAIHSYVAAFPEVDELRKLDQCMQAVRQVLIGIPRP